MSATRARAVLVVATVVAAPAALGVETAIRRGLFPADFEVLRAFLAPTLTPVAWGLTGLAGLAGFLGLSAQRRLVDERLARLPEGAPSDVRAGVRTQVFLLTASIPQVPVLVSTFAVMFGAALTPVAVGIAVSSIAVLAQGLRLGRGEDA